jgi:hypothetical protein
LTIYNIITKETRTQTEGEDWHDIGDLGYEDVISVELPRYGVLWLLPFGGEFTTTKIFITSSVNINY